MTAPDHDPLVAALEAMADRANWLELDLENGDPGATWDNTGIYNGPAFDFAASLLPLARARAALVAADVELADATAYAAQMFKEHTWAGGYFNAALRAEDQAQERHDAALADYRRALEAK